MTAFQIFAIAVTAGFAVVSVVGAVRRQIAVRSGVLWALLWAAATAAIAYPDMTAVVARGMGIARGADLVFYCAIIGMLIGFFAVYVKLRRTERAITVLVRQLALTNASSAEHPDTAASPPETP